MNDKIIPSLKLVFKPLIMYDGEWELLSDLRELSKENKEKKLFDEFMERYYYMPLNVIFKDEELTRSFKYAFSSRLGENGRNLYFSKKAFLRNVISNADEIIESNGDTIYKSIKKAIRDRKDVYRDVYNLGEESPYYNEVLSEFEKSNLDLTFEEYVKLCKKKFTRLLTGYNTVLDLFDKPINLDKFINCFDANELYLYTAYSILKNSEKYFNKHKKSDYNIAILDSYKELINDIRKDDKLYNSHILINKKQIYTIDDLFSDYEKLLKKAN